MKRLAIFTAAFAAAVQAVGPVFRRVADQQQQSRGFPRDGRTLGGRKRARHGRTEIAFTDPAVTHSRIEMRQCSCQLTD